ncbi:GNAT family N-acetyltransferase [Nonomuraea sp. NPDC050663]|uniref:GNAT family N-acetyltransferase n=1 Tax=Nonomuraea sp. NPDC050663 TaxID=3364370 RepID=UPI0037A36A61
MRIAELRTVDDFQRAYRLFDDIWHPEPGNPPMPVELMVAFAHAGGYLAGAYSPDGEMVGASVGFLADGNALHSHVTGARPGMGIGTLIKRHQRQWCLERGITAIRWTFDPLVRRNAYFNLVKLGARPEEYLEDFYGEMADAVNAGDPSDRLLAVWRLDREPEGVPHGEAVEALDGEGRVHDTDAPLVLVATPDDIEKLRTAEPDQARDWRLAMREVLGGLMAAGAEVCGFTGSGQYVVKR